MSLVDLLYRYSLVLVFHGCSKVCLCALSSNRKCRQNGKADSGHQRYLYFYYSCKKSFQLTYTYNANQPITHVRIIDMMMNCSGVRDIGRVRKISPTTVIAHLKSCSLQ